MKSPEEIPTLVALIQRMSTDRKLVVAMESSGTYGDALRQALADAKIAVSRVSNKASHDYAEIFDGVLRAITIIDNGLIKIIDGRFECTKQVPVASSLFRSGVMSGTLAFRVGVRQTGCRHQRRIQGTSQPSRRQRSIAA